MRENAASFGTVSTTAGLYDIQITTYREEGYAIGERHPKVRLIQDIDSDLSRRDFTVNSIALSGSEIVDPYNGREDLKKKIIRCVGDPAQKMNDDPLRIVRAYRLVSSYGLNIDPLVDKAMQSSIDLLQIVSTERLAEEFRRN